jgi:hypothetical protein
VIERRLERLFGIASGAATGPLASTCCAPRDPFAGPRHPRSKARGAVRKHSGQPVRPAEPRVFEKVEPLLKVFGRLFFTGERPGLAQVAKLALKRKYNEPWMTQNAISTYGDMISALNRPHELRTHIRGALRNGVTRQEIREVFLQVAIYCGVPAGVDSFRTAREVFGEIDGRK